MLKTGLAATDIKKYHKMLEDGVKPDVIARTLRVKKEVLAKHAPEKYEELAKKAKAKKAEAKQA